MTTWSEHQAWEQRWWGKCTNTFAEEAKQITYAHRMGLVVVKHPEFYETWPLYDAGRKDILDIGGGPTSLLLKTMNFKAAVVIDPCPYPKWVTARYRAAGIDQIVDTAESMTWRKQFDEAWIYNVLQHVVDPELIIVNARAAAKVIRIFEWIDRDTGIGHPHSLSREKLDSWLGGAGKVEFMNGENNCNGPAYYGCFTA